MVIGGGGPPEACQQCSVHWATYWCQNLDFWGPGSGGGSSTRFGDQMYFALTLLKVIVSPKLVCFAPVLVGVIKVYGFSMECGLVPPNSVQGGKA